MKYLSKNIEYIGFDMDGTLYDEFEFISQVYKEISKITGYESYQFMCNRWIEKGSSYNKIFDETYDMYGLDLEYTKEEFINKGLEIFRNFSPNISLSTRVKHLLTFYKQNYQIFLISDGNPLLQKKKFFSLGLENFFNDSDVVFTGSYSQDHYKPNTKSIELLDIDTTKTLFFGDRDIDEIFAKNVGLKFVKVYNMVEII